MEIPEQTLQDTTDVITGVQLQVSDAPYFFIGKEEAFRDGIPLGENLFQADWITATFIAVLILYAIVALFSRHLFAEILRSFSFRKPSYQASDIHGIFSWQATLANLASFINLSFFVYFITLRYWDWFPFGFTGFQRWGIILVSIMVIVTSRHMVTLITGSISSTYNTFMEYLNAIYTGYRGIGLGIFPVIVAISLLYDPPVDILLKTGIGIIIITYIIRITRLLIIFLQNRLPLFYYILYLCALEFLPFALLYRVIAG